MDAPTVATFFGLLLLGGLAGLGAAWLHPGVRATVGESRLTIAATVAVGATLGSLWFSERAGYVPCELCWYQRFAMYPLGVLLAVAAWRGLPQIRRIALPLAVGGLAVSAYHVQLQLFPDQGSFCDASNPCSGRWVEAFGWMTIPQMAGIAFVLVIGLLLLPPTPTETPA